MIQNIVIKMCMLIVGIIFSSLDQKVWHIIGYQMKVVLNTSLEIAYLRNMVLFTCSLVCWECSSGEMCWVHHATWLLLW